MQFVGIPVNLEDKTIDSRSQERKKVICFVRHHKQGIYLIHKRKLLEQKLTCDADVYFAKSKTTVAEALNVTNPNRTDVPRPAENCMNTALMKVIHSWRLASVSILDEISNMNASSHWPEKKSQELMISCVCFESTGGIIEVLNCRSVNKAVMWILKSLRVSLENHIHTSSRSACRKERKERKESWVYRISNQVCQEKLVMRNKNFWNYNYTAEKNCWFCMMTR